MTINPFNYKISPSLTRQFVTSLNKSGALLPVILLESTVTGGRTYQAYQRNGVVEARERITEESLAAIFWLFGAKMFGKLLDKVGQKFLNIPKNMPDVGRDSIRTPFNNYIHDVAKTKGLSAEQAASLKKYLANFSVGKTATSLLLACAFIGIVVPKLNQKITKLLYGKMQAADPNHTKAPDFHKDKLTIKDARTLFSAKDVSINAVENFKANPHKNKKPSFKSAADTALRIVQNFEENDVWKLMGTDVGTVSGRTINARNNDERIEIAFRDISSIYFYCFSMPAIVSFLNNHDVFKGKNTKLDPKSAMLVHNHLIEKMAATGMESTVNKDVFKEFALGKDLNKDLMSKFFEPREKTVTKKYLFGLIKKEKALEPRYMKLSEFESRVDRFVPKYQRASVKELGRKMAELMQPEKYFEEEKITAKIITETQVEDVLRGGEIRTPEFMSKTLNRIFSSDVKFRNKLMNKLFGSKGDATPLTNPYKYIASTEIEAKRKQVLNYVQAIVDDAAKTGTVTAERMTKLAKRNTAKNGLFMLLAMGVSSAFLSTIIPKIQYWITYLRTGKNEFPGLENLNQNK